MTARRDDVRFDDDAGPVLRPFAITNGRTSPSVALRLISLVQRTRHAVVRQADDPLLAELVRLCLHPTAVVEVSARCGHPVLITKILLSDLIQAGVVELVDDSATGADNERPDPSILASILDGLRKLDV